MKLPQLIKATFLERLNRFVGLVSVCGQEYTAYIRNTGRLRELLFKGNTVYLSTKTGKHPFEILLIDYRGFLVCIDSHMAPKLYLEHAKTQATFEPRFGNKRFDLLMEGRPVEVKSVNLVKGYRALFPDAPTKRGKEHIEKLIQLSREGYKPLIVFVVQREDARVFSPNWEVDPDFSRALMKYVELGLEVMAFRCLVSLEEIKIKDEIPVEVEP
ncbi:MAG: DNA/RNA nuclease SfsA [Aquificaceae bacterium]|nr:DNA/RNA nuclease SfsA [Aquificaceae bacterium]